MKIECPACGSSDVSPTAVTRTYSPPFGEPGSYEFKLQSCGTCGESGDFAGSSSEEIKGAIEALDRESAVVMLRDLSEAGVSVAYMERALGLPARTIARWKTKKISASGLALTRLVRCFPWLLDVAEAGYSRPVALHALLCGAGEALSQMASNAGYDISMREHSVEQHSFGVLTTFVPEPSNTIMSSNRLELVKRRSSTTSSAKDASEQDLGETAA